MPGRNRCLCSSVPTRSSAGPTWRSANQCAATGAPDRSSSSIAANRSNSVRSPPPYSRGQVIPIHPADPSAALNSGSNPVSHASLARRREWTAPKECRKADMAPRTRAIATRSPSIGPGSPKMSIMPMLLDLSSPACSSEPRTHDRNERNTTPGATAEVVRQRQGRIRQLTFPGFTAELEPAFVEHAESTRTDRMAKGLEPAVGVDGKCTVEIEHPVEDVLPAGPAL